MQRVFIGIPVDNPAQQQINELLSPVVKSHKGIRWVPEQNRHLTLSFLGDITAGVIGKLVHSMAQAYQGVPGFQTGYATLCRFPGSSGNIVALVLKADDQLASLSRITQQLLSENGLVPERSRFRPHVTLGRIRDASLFKTKFNQQTNINLKVNKITLYQSTLTQTGSIYLALKQIELG